MHATERNDHAPAVQATVGLILAGGAGTRFGGRDKAWLRLHGRPLLWHAWQRLRPQVDHVLVSVNRHRWAYRRLGMEAIPDRGCWRDAGPLAALATVGACRPAQRLALVPVDVPLAPIDQVARLARLLDAGAPAAALVADGRRQPLFALLAPGLAMAAATGLDRCRPPSVQAWLEDIGVVWLDYPAPPERFANVNRPDDLRRLAAGGTSCAPA